MATTLPTVNIPSCFAYAQSPDLLAEYLRAGVAAGDIPASVLAADGNVVEELARLVLAFPSYEDNGRGEAEDELKAQQAKTAGGAEARSLFKHMVVKVFPQWKVAMKDTWLRPNDCETGSVRIRIPRTVVRFSDLLARFVAAAVTAEPKLSACRDEAVAAILADISKHNYGDQMSWEDVAKFEVYQAQQQALYRRQPYVLAWVDTPVPVVYEIVGRSLMAEVGDVFSTTA